MLKDRILTALKQSQYWTPRTKEGNGIISNLICPVCGDKTAWTYSQSPKVIICNRLSKCGSRTKTLELFPEVRRNIERDFPATKSDPTRPAREYLLSRGFSEATLKGLVYRYMKNVRNGGSGAVLFPVGKDEKGKEVLNGRLFSPPPGEGKTHNIGSTSGRHWRHPGLTYKPEKRTWITEGILNALSLIELGEQSIAVLSSGQDPAKVDLSDLKNLVISFDNDEAGRHAIYKWCLAYPNASIILCDPGEDWNDLLTSGTIDKVKALFQANLPRYVNNGKLAIAENAQAYADIWHEFYGVAPGLFALKGSTYFSEKKAPRNGSIEDAFVAVSRCCKATIKVKSFILDTSNPVQPQYLYNLEITSAKGKPIEATATGQDLASPRRLKEWFLTYAKINFEGDGNSCKAVASMIADDNKAPEVKQLSVVGYQVETGNYVFAKWAIDCSGKMYLPDSRGVFQMGYNQHFRVPAHAIDKAIVPIHITKERVKEIYSLINDAWGFNGVAAFSWTVAGWFVNQLKASTDFFPFISLYGDPASGKSALVTILNTIQGRDIEGLPITMLNTRKGLTRTIGQLSGMFTALLEDSQRNEKGFDYSILLTAYNRGPLQVQAAFSIDLQTREAPFLGSLLFCQNIEPFNSKQEKQRVISLHFQTEQLTEKSRAAYEKIVAIDKKELAGIMLQVLCHRQHFAGWQKEYDMTLQDLAPMEERRILQNHALILAFYRLFCSCFDIPGEETFTAFFSGLGKQKCISSAIRQTSLADHFFELLDSVDEAKVTSALQIKNGHIYINLPRAEILIRNKGISFHVNDSLTTALQKHPAYERNGLKIRFPTTPDDDNGRELKRQARAWVFKQDYFIEKQTDEEC